MPQLHSGGALPHPRIHRRFRRQPGGAVPDNRQTGNHRRKLQKTTERTDRNIVIHPSRKTREHEKDHRAVPGPCDLPARFGPAEAENEPESARTYGRGPDCKNRQSERRRRCPGTAMRAGPQRDRPRLGKMAGRALQLRLRPRRTTRLQYGGRCSGIHLDALGARRPGPLAQQCGQAPNLVHRPEATSSKGGTARKPAV